MANAYIINKEPMDCYLVNVPDSISLKDKSYRSERAGSYGKWEITSGGVLERFLYITRKTYPEAVLVSNEHDADQAIRDETIYKKYLDLQSPDYGEQEYYRYHANSEHTDLLQAHLSQDLVVEFKAMCVRKRVKIREAMAVAIAEWINKNDTT
jgi:hypothetical protein